MFSPLAEDHGSLQSGSGGQTHGAQLPEQADRLLRHAGGGEPDAAIETYRATRRTIAVAGTQLDPRLTDVLVLAMESVAEAPAPSDARAPTAWLGEVTAA